MSKKFFRLRAKQGDAISTALSLDNRAVRSLDLATH